MSLLIQRHETKFQRMESNAVTLFPGNSWFAITLHGKMPRILYTVKPVMAPTISEKFSLQKTKRDEHSCRGVESESCRSLGFGPESESLVWRRLQLWAGPCLFHLDFLCNFIAVYL